ncbi:MAG TPA: glutamate-cysteine ligase family protein [Patescibacteria group bacterium]|nr:glutamate-cysteine ligase family protein [Patescibacteria group bacterium]
MLLYKKHEHAKKRGTPTYKTLEVLGPEHEFSLVDNELKALPIADKVLKDFHGRIVNFVKMPKFSFGKELQLHVMEVKPSAPFTSPVKFENTMQKAVLTLHEFVHQKYGAYLLGTGMHPLLKLDETGIWPHRHRQIYEAYSQIFSLKRHGWLNIQSYQLNLPYSNEKNGVLLHNLIANILPYLPAIAASSPIYEGKLGENVDNRLHFYKENQREIPSITADVIPEHAESFATYDREVIGKYSKDLAAAGANKLLLDKEWINSRGVIFRFDRRALEIRVMDEQECVKSDVALSCFIRALLRGLTKEETSLLQHEILVRDFNSVVKNGLNAKVENPRGKTARDVCRSLLRVALDHSTEEERSFLPIVQKRIENGNLSEILREQIGTKSQKTDFHEAVVSVYLKLTESLIDNQPHF